MNIRYIAFVFTLTFAEAGAGNSTLDAAIGGGTGGAAGAAIGHEVGGRDGAIVGGALVGAIGAAVSTGEKRHHSRSNSYRNEPRYIQPASRFCPPGQAKQGRC